MCISIGLGKCKVGALDLHKGLGPIGGIGKWHFGC